MDSSMVNLIELESYLKNPDRDISLFASGLPLLLSSTNVPSTLLSLTCIHIILQRTKKGDLVFRDYLMLLPQYFDQLVCLHFIPFCSLF